MDLLAVDTLTVVFQEPHVPCSDRSCGCWIQTGRRPCSMTHAEVPTIRQTRAAAPGGEARTTPVMLRGRPGRRLRCTRCGGVSDAGHAVQRTAPRAGCPGRAGPC